MANDVKLLFLGPLILTVISANNAYGAEKCTILKEDRAFNWKLSTWQNVTFERCSKLYTSKYLTKVGKKVVQVKPNLVGKTAFYTIGE